MNTPRSLCATRDNKEMLTGAGYCQSSCLSVAQLLHSVTEGPSLQERINVFPWLTSEGSEWLWAVFVLGGSSLPNETQQAGNPQRGRGGVSNDPFGWISLKIPKKEMVLLNHWNKDYFLQFDPNLTQRVI